ncbi:YrhK family protein [Cytobacillus gottheilii]|uniref:YrhK family protein n=1 Tax=Cytobacillus gottheilii TaxID=859144 RepID=A0ABX8FA36_9BACI|nr:YrhK family protein [Cytobacillus gottheilii]QVY61186.1 YrhK family protein [Cytobacillus gottheilii]
MLKNVKRKEYDGGIDIEIDQGRFKIQFAQYTYIIQWIADTVIGCFFITGSILNLLNVPSVYPNSAYLIGSLAMIVRPIIRVFRHINIRKLTQEDEEKNDTSLEEPDQSSDGQVYKG